MAFKLKFNTLGSKKVRTKFELLQKFEPKSSNLIKVRTQKFEPFFRKKFEPRSKARTFFPNTIPRYTTLNYLSLANSSVVLDAPQGCIETFRANVLYRHNQLRALHGSQPLVASSSLDTSAQNWATKLAIDNDMYHSHWPDIGIRIEFILLYLKLNGAN